MSIPGMGGTDGAGGAAASAIGNSLRFRASASAYLSRTFGSPTSRTTWTFSTWVKRGALGVNQAIFSCGSFSTDLFQIYFEDTTNGIKIQNFPNNPTPDISVLTSATYRDPAAWLHIVVVMNTTSAQTSGNASDSRVRLFVNGSQVTALASSTMPAQNATPNLNTSALSHVLGARSAGTLQLDGVLSQVCFVDGQALAPSVFGATDSTSGEWKPKTSAAIRTGVGTWGTNGFMLLFNDTASTTTLGYDRQVSDSGSASNNWTCNNISLTAGVTYDAFIDSPNNGSSATQPVGNYCTLNPIQPSNYTSGILTRANLRTTVTGVANNYPAFGSTLSLPTTGSYYWEVTKTAGGTSAGHGYIGIATQSTLSTVETTLGSANYTMYAVDGTKRINSAGASAYGSAITDGSVVGVLYNADSAQVTFFLGTTSQGAISITVASDMIPIIQLWGQSTMDMDINFGQRPFTNKSTNAPTAKTLCTSNLGTPAIDKPSLHHYVNTRTGTGAAANVTGMPFQPDLIWTKVRNAVGSHILTDAVRGNTKVIASNLTDAEATVTTAVTAFNSDGWSEGTNAGMGFGETNINGSTYVNWLWKANGAGSSNTSGSITSTVSANTTAGFSIVTYTGTGANATVGHGLGAAPKMVIVKRRNAAGYNWQTYHANLTSAVYGLYLNTTGAQFSDATAWNSTAPTSTVFSLGTATDGNANTATYVAYCFAEIAGFSKFGSYTGNGSSDGPFVFCGFRPRWLLVKNITTAGGGWRMLDTARSAYNVVGLGLVAQASDAETSGDTFCDINSNGFKVRQSTAAMNTNTDTYIFAAFAESPLQYANAR